MTRSSHYIVCTLKALIFCAVFSSAQVFSDSLYGVFCGAKDQTELVSLTPISALDDDALYLSALHLRSRVMSAQQRVFNYYWIHQEASNTIIGSRALSKILRFGFARYWQERTDALMGNIDESPLMEVSSWKTPRGDYSLRASDDSVALRFSMTF